MRRWSHLITGVLIPLTAACGGDRTTAPPTQPSDATYLYSISGTVSDYRSGPIAGVNVTASSSSACFGCGQVEYWPHLTTLTDEQGRYRLSRKFSGNVGLSVFKDGYVPAWKNSLPVPESTVDFVLHPSTEVSAKGDTVSGTIDGDDYISGDAVLFAGACSRVPCKVLHFRDYPAPRVEVRLRFAYPPCVTCVCYPNCVGDGSSRLALYFTALPDLESGPPFASLPPGRYCCSNSSNEPIVATFAVPYEGYMAIAYEQSENATAGLIDSTPFELIVRPVP